MAVAGQVPLKGPEATAGATAVAAVMAAAMAVARVAAPGFVEQDLQQDLVLLQPVQTPASLAALDQARADG